MNGQETSSQAGGAGTSGPGEGRLAGPAWRTALAAALGVLTCLVLAAAVLATWIHWTTFNTTRFVNTIAPTIQEPEVSRAVSREAIGVLFDELDLRERIEEGVRDLLPESLEELGAEPAATGAEALATRLGEEILKSDQFQAVWRGTLTVTHEQVVAGLRAEGPVQVRGRGRVVLDISELLVELKDRLTDLGLEFLEDIEVPEDIADIELYQDEQIEDVRTAVTALDTLFWALPLATVLLLTGAVAAANDRRRAFTGVAVGMIVVLVILLIALVIVRNHYIGDIRDSVNQEAAQVVAGRVQDSLNRVSIGIIALGLLGLVAAVLSGPYGWAVRLHEKERGIMRRLGRGAGAESFPERYPWLLRTAGLAAAVIIMLYLPQVSVAALIIVCAIFALYLAAVEFLR